MKEEEKKYLDTEDASSYLGIKPRTLKEWKSKGKIDAKKLGKRLYWLIEDLNDLIEKGI